MTVFTYKQWRTELNNIQIKIDVYDANFYDNICDGPSLSILEEQKLTDDYKRGREKLTDELEAHYKKEPKH